MLIACLGWGSLIWDPRELPVRGTWFTDGPFLPIEFARQSSDGRLTLVLVADRVLVRSLWTAMSGSILEDARGALAKREGISKDRVTEDIGMWSGGETADPVVQRIAAWARAANIDAVVWTSLPPKFANTPRQVPSEEEAVAYLGALPHEHRRHAEQYIRMAPRQIDTDYRRRFEREWGWTPTSPI